MVINWAFLLLTSAPPCLWVRSLAIYSAELRIIIMFVPDYSLEFLRVENICLFVTVLTFVWLILFVLEGLFETMMSKALLVLDLLWGWLNEDLICSLSLLSFELGLYINGWFIVVVVLITLLVVYGIAMLLERCIEFMYLLPNSGSTIILLISRGGWLRPFLVVLSGPSESTDSFNLAINADPLDTCFYCLVDRLFLTIYCENVLSSVFLEGLMMKALSSELTFTLWMSTFYCIADFDDMAFVYEIFLGLSLMTLPITSLYLLFMFVFFETKPVSVWSTLA